MTANDYENKAFDFKWQIENEIDKLRKPTDRQKAQRQLENAFDWLQKLYDTLYR